MYSPHLRTTLLFPNFLSASFAPPLAAPHYPSHVLCTTESDLMCSVFLIPSLLPQCVTTAAQETFTPIGRWSVSSLRTQCDYLPQSWDVRSVCMQHYILLIKLRSLNTSRLQYFANYLNIGFYWEKLKVSMLKFRYFIDFVLSFQIFAHLFSCRQHISIHLGQVQLKYLRRKLNYNLFSDFDDASSWISLERLVDNGS